MVGLASGLGVATADATYGGDRRVRPVGDHRTARGLAAAASASSAGSSCCGSPGGPFAVGARSARRPSTERRGGLAGAYLSILGLTLTNPMTILSFGALFAGLGVHRRERRSGRRCSRSASSWARRSWWVILTFVVGRLRTRVTPRALRIVNVVSGVVIGAFAISSIVLALRGPA